MSSIAVTPVGSEQLAPTSKAKLAGEVLATYLRMRMLLHRSDLAHTVRALREPLQGPGADEATDRQLLLGLRLGWAVERTLRLLPTDSRCLMRSLVLLALLARRGHECTLVLGVAPGPEFRAHAWIELAGEAVLASGGDEYARLLEI